MIKFPINCHTEASKLSFLFRCEGKLIDRHNVKGEQFNNGEITQDEWDSFRIEYFDVKLMLIHSELGKIKPQARQGNFWEPNLDMDIIDG